MRSHELALRLAIALLMLVGTGGAAAPPEQFRVWGSAGPQFPPVPEGWKEVRGASEGLTSVTATPDETRRGYVLFARDPMMPVSPDTVPFPSERVTELRAFAARGEYEPLTFLIHALEPLRQVEVQVSDLRSAEGTVIPGDHIDVRVVRCIRVQAKAQAKTYRLKPFLLEKRERFAVPKGKTAQVWLTVKVPETARGGDYTGTISARAAGREATQLKVSVCVLPFVLPLAPAEVTMFYPRPAQDDEALLKQLTDMREHGCNALVPAIDVQIKSRDRNFGHDDVAATRAHCKRIMDAVKRVFGRRRFLVTFGVGHQIAYYWDQRKNWFSFWPHSKKIEDDLFKAIGVVRELAKAEGWPPLRAYALDEAGAHNLLDEAVYYYRLIKKRTPALGTWTTIGGGMAMGHDEIGQLSEVVDFFSTNRFTPEIARALVERRRPFGIYNGAGPTPAGARFFFGFYGWKTGARQIGQWVYHFGNSVFEGKGFRRGDEGYVYLAADGPLPSPMWEAAREGIDDHRYLHLLWRTIAAARASKRPGAQKAAEEALRALTQILGKIDWRFMALHGGERTPPPHPSTLRKWRWKVAGQIVKLRNALGGGEMSTVHPRPISPFDFPWAEPEKEKLRRGPELLPPSGFEATLKPWRVEAWKGKGKGEIDEKVSHGGKRSVRIDVPAGSGSLAVTVLVWPSWGGGKLDLTLEGERIYELSAWAKWKGRRMPPSARIAVPKGAAKTTRTGKDEPRPDGWQRIWARAEMSFGARPRYLAVWVQGEGTVWVDDLSLREIIPPALRLSLDQDEYDSADKVGIATAAITKRATPAQVRFTLSRAEGEAVAQLTAPFRSQASVASAPAGQAAGVIVVAPVTLGRCRFIFNPSALAPGHYQAKVELLDAAGDAFAARTKAFQRNED